MPAKEKMNIVIVGHVDHGKSTVIGRLLADTGSLPKVKLAKVNADCKKNSKPFEYAFLLDALRDEQSQGITIDSARCFFKSTKRDYIIIDAPGHIEFLKNMISGAARAEAAILVIDAAEGIKENSKRHGYMLSMLGIKQVMVCINKMDMVGYKKTVYNNIEKEYSKFLEHIGIQPMMFIPLSAREGDNIIKASPKLSWFKGKNLLTAIDFFKKEIPLREKAFRMPMQDVYKFTAHGDDRRIIAGRIESGSIAVGDDVVFLPSNKRSSIKSIEGFSVKKALSRNVGHSIGVTLTEQIYVNRGEVMCKADEDLPVISSLLKVELFWMGKKPLMMDKEYLFKIGTTRVPFKVKEIKRVIDASDLKKEKKKNIGRHDVAECILETLKPVAFDLTSDLQSTSRFVIVDDHDIRGGGIITALVEDEQHQARQQVFVREERWEKSIIDPKDRSLVYAQRPKLILLTGQTRFDKKSIAKQLEKKLFELGKKVYFLGIGNLLRGLDIDVDEQRAQRGEHVRRLAEVAHIMMDAGLIVIATASNLSDEELKLIQTLNDRGSIFIINVGKSKFKDGNNIDLNLDTKDGEEANLIKVLDLLKFKNVMFSL